MDPTGKFQTYALLRITEKALDCRQLFDDKTLRIHSLAYQLIEIPTKIIVATSHNLSSCGLDIATKKFDAEEMLKNIAKYTKHIWRLGYCLINAFKFFFIFNKFLNIENCPWKIQTTTRFIQWRHYTHDVDEHKYDVSKKKKKKKEKEHAV